jgi:hypothetical protein
MPQQKRLHFRLNINRGMYTVQRERNLFFAQKKPCNILFNNLQCSFVIKHIPAAAKHLEFHMYIIIYTCCWLRLGNSCTFQPFSPHTAPISYFFPWSRILREKTTSYVLVKKFSPPTFMEPQGPLPCSQKPAQFQDRES